jgi:hypothetical protein
MILPPKEANQSHTQVQFKGDADISLKYQLEKILHICKNVEGFLDKQAISEKWTVDVESIYAVESLISNYSILIEYYYSWIVYSYIGTITHARKIEYKLWAAEEKEKFVEDAFKKYEIGKSKLQKIDDFKEKCKDALLKAYDFLFLGKYHEIYVLNNFIKHNRIFGGYAPKVLCGENLISVPYVYIAKHNEVMVNSSVLKCFFGGQSSSNSKTKDANKKYFTGIFKSTKKKLGEFGANSIFHVNGIDYIVSENNVGISVESILDITYELCLKITEFMAEASKEQGSKILQRLIRQVKERKPKTLNRLIKKETS